MSKNIVFNKDVSLKKYENINTSLYSWEVFNGLKVIFVKKEGFQNYAINFGCNFGGAVTKYEVDGKIYNIPYGVAHFLEHQMFEMEGEITNASDYLAMFGIESNAFTSYDKTIYQVNGSDNFQIALNYILDFVQTPYFRKDNIDIERDIIIQEILMYQDLPFQKVRSRLKLNNFGDVSYSHDVTGSVEDVNKIDEDVLNQVYNHFYVPSNMTIAIIGNFDYQDIYMMIEENQRKKPIYPSFKAKVINDEISNEVIKKDDEMKIDIVDTVVAYAVRVKPNFYNNEDDNNNLLVNICKYDLLCEVLFGHSSANFQTIMDNDLALLGFGCSFIYEAGIPSIRFNGLSHKPEELVKFLNDVFLNLDEVELDDKYVQALNRASIGSTIRDFNDLSTTITDCLEYSIDGINLFDEYNHYISLNDLRDITKYIDVNNINYVFGKSKKNDGK